MRVLATCALLTAAMLTSTLAAGQVGAVTGRVLDTGGEALPGVTVEAARSDQPERRMAVTDLAGRYEIDELPPGEYTVLFTLPGFRSILRQGIDVGDGITATVDAEMGFGDINDDVLVEFSGPLSDAAVALLCTFHPDGVIDGCRTVDVAGQLYSPR